MWYKNPEIDKSPVISSRVRLARNIYGYPFFALLKPSEAKKMINDVVNSLSEQNFEFTNIKDKSDVEKLAMLEHHKISIELLRSVAPSGVLSNRDETLHIMLNEEDHIRIQSIAPGKDIKKAWQLANDVDNVIEEQLEYAFDEKFGYLTSCPSNTGTGMRASFMLHLPMLEYTGKLTRIINSLRTYGMTIRGVYGENSGSIGNIYQISNQVTLGKSEEEIFDALESITAQVVENELLALNDHIKKHPIYFEDKVYRALGILTQCRQIEIKEARTLLSTLRLGLVSGVLKPKIEGDSIYNTIVNIEVGNLQLNTKTNLNSDDDANVARAQYIRQTLVEKY